MFLSREREEFKVRLDGKFSTPKDVRKSGSDSVKNILVTIKQHAHQTKKILKRLKYQTKTCFLYLRFQH